MRRALRAAAALALLAAPLLGCKRRAAPERPPPAASAPAPEEAPLPVDHALPNELAEGTDKAFGLPIPRRMTITGRYGDMVSASGDVPAEMVANYVRRRVIAAHVETGPSKTVFDRATTKERPGPVIRIDVIARSGATDLYVRDETVPEVHDGLTPEERWKQNGLRPDGTLIDPGHLE
ncbi:MAG: hypothetical protein U0359_20120 [Byssovorax sp.]